MALTLRVKAGQATFQISDGPMKAEWTLSTAMDEEQLVDALVGMLRYIKRTQPYDGRHLHAVADDVETHLPELPGGVAISKLSRDQLTLAPAPMTWAPAIKPVPLQDSLEAATGNGFELIPPDELD